MVQVPTTTPSTGYRNNILHISYCAAGVSRRGRRPEVIPAVSSFFPFSYPSYFIPSYFISSYFIPSYFISSYFISSYFISSFFISSFFPSLTLSSPSLFVFSHFSFHPPFSSLTLSSPSLFSVAPPYSCSHSFFFSHSFIPLSFYLLSVTPLTPLSSFLGCPSLLRFPLLFLLSLFHPSLSCLLSVTPLPYPPLDTLRFFPPD